jgi:integrase
MTDKRQIDCLFGVIFEVIAMNEEYPFSLWQRADRPNYYVQFKNEKNGVYMRPICTKQATKAQALKVAWKWYTDGIPQKSGTESIHNKALADMIRRSDMTTADAENIIKELKKKGLVKSAIMTGTRADRDVIDFLLEAWDFDKSPYVKERLRKNHGIHRTYCHTFYNSIRKYWKPFFEGRLLGSLTKVDIESFIDSLEKIKSDRKKEKPLAPLSKNRIIQAGTIALKWAYTKQWIDTDLSAGIVFFAGQSKERQILTPEMVKALFAADWKNEKAKLANMLACVTGLRAGEILALRAVDLGNDCLYIKHSINSYDGLKSTKNGENRTVQVPFPFIMTALINLARSNPHGQGADGYVFYSDTITDKPLDINVLLKGLRQGLQTIGISAAESKKYTVHGWRHYFTAYMKGKIDDRLLKLQTGHKTDSMLIHYSDHSIDGQAAIVQAAQIQTFGSLLPERIGA